MRYVGFDDLTQEHLTALAASMLAAPSWQRPEVDDLLRGVQQEAIRCFEIDGGLMLVSVSEHDGSRRLRIDAFSGRILNRRQLAADLRRLAADWECDTIETFVFDARLASAIQAVGGRIEAWSMSLTVESPDGQE